MAPGNVTEHDIAKSGYLIRRTSVLHRWKKCWIVLYRSGRLAYFDDPNASKADDVIDIPRERAIVVGPSYCSDVQPPEEGMSKLLFGVKTTSKIWHFCADDIDDLTAWKLALEEALNAVYTANPPAASGEGAYAGYVLPQDSNSYTIYAPPGSTVMVTDRGPTVVYPDGRTVYVYEEHPYYRNYVDNAGMGLLAGAAMGSMFLWPWALWWW